LKNIIIAGPSRAGKSTLARILNEELNYFINGLDKLVAAFGGAYPQLDIRLDWDREKTTNNIAPFLGHFLGMFSSDDGRGLLPYSHSAIKGNRFILEGGSLICFLTSLERRYARRFENVRTVHGWGRERLVEILRE